MQRIKRDDQVLVMAGKDKGKQGQVREVLLNKHRALVQGVNMVKRHQAQRNERTPAGIIEKEAPLHLSNLQLICRSCEKAVRVKFRTRTDGAKVRVCKSCDQDID